MGRVCPEGSDNYGASKYRMTSASHSVPPPHPESFGVSRIRRSLGNPFILIFHLKLLRAAPPPPPMSDPLG